MEIDTEDMAIVVKPARVIAHCSTDRAKTVALTYPLEIDGVPLDNVVVRRLTAGEVAEFIETITKAGEDAKLLRFPMFYNEHGNRLDDEIIDALDDDDAAKLIDAASDFLPQRFRVDTEPAMRLNTGEPIAHS